MSKFTINGLKEEYQSYGWTLLSDKYTNLSTEMECSCPEGHRLVLTYDKWRRHHECPLCAKSELKEAGDGQIYPKKKGIKRILAFDQATSISGWSVFDGNKLIKYGKFETTSASSVEKIAEVKSIIASMIINWRPDRVILEDIQYQAGAIENVQTFKTLAQLQGVLMNYFCENKIKYDIVHTAKWREFSDIKGKTRSDKKRSAQKIMGEIYDITPTQDEADAIGIGRYGASLHKDFEMTEWI